MKKALFIIIIGLSACTTENKQANISVADTTSKFKNIDSVKVDTLNKAPAKEKSFEQQADERLDKIIKKRKNVK
ncbi:hypothetical protein [Pedobacter insulae]|uniref:Lipoprotein n=1 Tax=Pedobacter insulae TaxID=414048 RepID=A0A1I3AFR3_9SPHI|nr:hypothetical protein [Pedobacter insulae]SFH48858.1 hypothetical protein SAMN04489864_11475 [Pedobacter insulae]